MSYQLELGEVPAREVRARLRQRAEVVTAGWDSAMRDAVMDHAVDAATATEAILVALGEPETVRVAVVGHANAGHESREGDTPESMTISVGVVPAQAQDEPGEQQSSDAPEPVPAEQ